MADPSLDSRVLAAVAAGGVISCASAAQSHGLELLSAPAIPHVTIPRSHRPLHARDAMVHRRDVPSFDGITTLARTAADCARCLPSLEALVVVDAVLSRGVARDEVLLEARGRGSAAVRAVVARAVAGAGSSGETVARVALLDAGLAVEPQVFVSGVGWVDLLVQGRVVVEIDGYRYHSDPRQFARDRQRDAALVAMGYVVLRFTWADAVHRPEYVVQSVLAALGRHR